MNDDSWGVERFNLGTIFQMKNHSIGEMFKGSRRSKKVQNVQRSSNVQCPENNVIYNNPNFYTELCCEVSGDAAREGANRALEP